MLQATGDVGDREKWFCCRELQIEVCVTNHYRHARRFVAYDM